jgi:hypothetical protein
VTGTMTWAAMDVHARSTYAASLDVVTGELSRQRFAYGCAARSLAVLRSTLSVPRAPMPIAGTNLDVDSAIEDMTEWWLTDKRSCLSRCGGF